MQEGKQEAEARGRECLLIMGWSTTTTYFVNINTSLLPHVESLGPLRFRKRPQLCLTLLTNACSQQDHVTWLRKWNSTVPQLSQALFRVLKLQLCPEKAETEEHNSTDWNRWTARSDPGGSDPFTTRAGKVSGNGKRADHICPKKEKKKTQQKHCFGYKHFIHLSTTTIKDLYKIMLW